MVAFITQQRCHAALEIRGSEWSVSPHQSRKNLAIFLLASFKPATIEWSVGQICQRQGSRMQDWPFSDLVTT